MNELKKNVQIEIKLTSFRAINDLHVSVSNSDIFLSNFKNTH